MIGATDIRRVGGNPQNSDLLAVTVGGILHSGRGAAGSEAPNKLSLMGILNSAA